MALSAETQGVYLNRLIATRADVLTKAVDMLIDNWPEPHKMPPVSSILYAYNHILETAVDMSAEILQRPAKPDNLSDEERRNYAKELIEEMRKQLATGAFVMPAYREIAERNMAKQNGKTEVPTDPLERIGWATEKAKKMGWTE